MSSPCPESKLYQVETLQRAGSFQILIFRVKPTDEGDFIPSFFWPLYA